MATYDGEVFVVVVDKNGDAVMSSKCVCDGVAKSDGFGAFVDFAVLVCGNALRSGVWACVASC